MKSERKTALVLSGGGSRGAYQAGAWQAIQELGIHLDMVVGVSVGALNGAMVVQGDPIKTANLWRQMETDMIFDVNNNANMADFAKEFFEKGGAGTTGLQKIIKEYADEDVIRNSPMDFGILTVEFPSTKPYYLWKEDIPEGKLADYITASASAFPALQPYEIDGKEFIDGGYEDNLPIAMAVKRGATDIIAIYLDAVGKFDKSELDLPEHLTFIGPKQDLGDFLIFDKSNSRRIIRLGYLDAMKKFGIYDGDRFAFDKGAFDKRYLKQAEAAATIFELDPLILYRRQTFLDMLTEKVKEAADAVQDSYESPAEASFEKFKDLLKNTLNRKTGVMVIANMLLEKGTESMFNSKYAKRFLDDEIAAAKFLLNAGVLPFKPSEDKEDKNDKAGDDKKDKK